MTGEAPRKSLPSTPKASASRQDLPRRDSQQRQPVADDGGDGEERTEAAQLNEAGEELFPRGGSPAAPAFHGAAPPRALSSLEPAAENAGEPPRRRTGVQQKAAEPAKRSLREELDEVERGEDSRSAPAPKKRATKQRVAVDPDRPPSKLPGQIAAAVGVLVVLGVGFAFRHPIRKR